LAARLPYVYPRGYSPQFFERYGFRVKLTRSKRTPLAPSRGICGVLLGGVAVVLAIACANVANLFLARVESRRHELAIRAALGAHQHALAVHILMENLTLAF
jgi:ABC-type antimicrobial peptide transport system permease subunit